MSSESEEEPFPTTHTDSDSDFNPSTNEGDTEVSSTSDNDEPNLEVARGRKRLRKEKLWKRNQRKQKRVSGKQYINSKGKVVSERVMGNACNCKWKCFDHVTPEVSKLQSKDLQDSYLSGLITVQNIQRRRPHLEESNKTKLVSCTYKIQDGRNNQTVCKKAMMAIHGITKGRLNRIIHHLKQNVTPPVDMRGKHTVRPNKVPKETLTKLRDHILSFPRYKSHYSRRDNLARYYLSPLLNTTKMYELYLKKHEPEQYLLLSENKAISPKVKYEFFRKYFVENFNMTFGTPKSDTCQKCDKLTKQIEGATTEEEKNTLSMEKQIHVAKADTFYEDLKEKTQLAKTQDHIEVITFNFQQNFPLPVCSSGEVFYKIQLWVYNFCVHVGSTGRSYFFIYDETIGSKGQNEVISMLSYAFNKIIKPEVTDIYMFSDNCSSQNKNYVMVEFLYSIVHTGKFNLIYHRFPEPGHSFLPCDRSFGSIERVKKKHDKIYLPDEYVKIIQNSGKNFEVIKVSQDMFLNYKTHYAPLFLKNPGTKQTKFTISKYRIFQYAKKDCPKFRCSESVALPVLREFSLMKKSNQENISLPDGDQLLYDRPRLLKQKKMEHVMELAKHYVPAADMWYYDQIASYHHQFADESQNTSCSEYDSDN